MQETLLSRTPYSNCKNDTFLGGGGGSGFIRSSTTYLLCLQGKADFFFLSAKAEHCQPVIRKSHRVPFASSLTCGYKSCPRWGLGWHFY